MDPRDIAIHLTRPMSDEDAHRMILARYGAREVADPDAASLAEIEASITRIERAEAEKT